MIEIPEDILKAANACFCHGALDEATGKPVVTRDLIARAILAEREACAKIAQTERTPYWMAKDHALNIAALILRR